MDEREKRAKRLAYSKEYYYKNRDILLAKERIRYNYNELYREQKIDDMRKYSTEYYKNPVNADRNADYQQNRYNNDKNFREMMINYSKDKYKNMPETDKIKLLQLKRFAYIFT